LIYVACALVFCVLSIIYRYISLCVVLFIKKNQYLTFKIHSLESGAPETTDASRSERIQESHNSFAKKPRCETEIEEEKDEPPHPLIKSALSGPVEPGLMVGRESEMKTMSEFVVKCLQYKKGGALLVVCFPRSLSSQVGVPL
jgi:hypothetical protein